jgi:acylphosphatase
MGKGCAELRQRAKGLLQFSICEMEKKEKKARLYRVNGRVQGVGYRNFAEWVARGLGLEGYVRNLRNGSVEVYAMGPETELRKFATELQKGPRMARVDSVHEEPAEPDEKYAGRFTTEFTL